MFKINDVSLIVPFYNEEKSISRCILSIFNQSIKPFEVIFVDNNSSDNSAQVIENTLKLFEKTFSVSVIKETKKGIPFARNAGIRSATGKIIVFLDADCVAPKDYIKFILEDFNSHNVNAVTGRYIIRGNDDLKATWRQRAWSKHFGWNSDISVVNSMNDQDGTIVSGCSAFLKETLEKLDLFDERYVFMDDIALSEKFYPAGFTTLKDGRLTVTHFINTDEKCIMKKDYRYGKDRALIYKLSDRTRFKFHSKHYVTLIKTLISYMRVRDKYYLYEMRTLIYFKIGLFIKGLKVVSVYI